MNIGELAAASGVAARTIRYYESTGLIPPARRGGNGYRVYDDRDVATLRFVSRARGLGFAVRDVARLLDLWHDRDRASAAVKRLAQAHMAAIDAKLSELEAMRATLADLVDRCRGDDRPDCPIITDLAGG